ncbi:MotA/TolQ/ExbB proton channel family protein [Anaeromyxobacter sp. Fw109-5]|uniref:MotA/TolQ/ExbB proton channel family protein n=1 Tax=Anaeromyxobacter sp. (strain Fw109-5) TaxID=404589 RepID=UPI000158A7E4|nr:MotA/TolQ/ExbB proton channel family protein [Anaeromyxobacter sp. Fw109-5]ABS24388.1 MotA/TolQ/ExbB proton channel [Anaeromyxobacter sp. Fw109-5]
MLQKQLLGFTNLGAEWVLWLLIALSVASIGVMIERVAFFLSRRAGDVDALRRQLLAGDLAGASAAVEGRRGMEAEVVRAAVAHAAMGPDAVREVVSGTIERSRIDYEQRLAFLGTLGNNAPFIGLFGTVLGIVRAFFELSRNPGAAGAGTVMAGISEALVATAVGLFVALPAVVAYNLFQRGLRRTAQRATALGHAAIAHLEARPGREA